MNLQLLVYWYIVSLSKIKKMFKKKQNKSNQKDQKREKRSSSGGVESRTFDLWGQHVIDEWFSSNQRPMFYTQGSGIARGQTLQVATKKCMA